MRDGGLEDRIDGRRASAEGVIGGWDHRRKIATTSSTLRPLVSGSRLYVYDQNMMSRMVKTRKTVGPSKS